MKITILGCGGSGGVPTAGGDWGECDRAEPRNRRSRPAILIQSHTTTLLVDTGPDIRSQLLATGVHEIDAILYTHHHADHTHGFDDIRYLNVVRGQPMPIYGNAATLAEMQQRFAYAFAPRESNHFYRPAVIPHILYCAAWPPHQPRAGNTTPIQIGDMLVQPFAQDHGSCVSVGIRVGDFAYSTDVRALDETAFGILAGVKVWVVDALREEPHPVHSHVAQTLAWIARVQPQQAYLTHMNQSLDYQTLLARCPANVAPAYDGLVIQLPHHNGRP
jgi:phosphoribosyl 1,2-cyclic phosphate phosphodiesterase